MTSIALYLALAVPLAPKQQSIASVDYRGKTITIDQFRKVAKPLDFRIAKSGATKLIGFAVVAEGPLVEDPTTLNWYVVVQDAKRSDGIRVAVDRDLLPRDVLEGASYRILGILREDGNSLAIVVKRSELVPPDVKWEYRVLPPNVIAGGEESVWRLRIQIKNTGRQRLSRMTLTCHLKAQLSPAEAEEDVVLRDFAAGETRDIVVPFRLFNYQYIGAVSTKPPVVNIAVTDFAL